MAEEEGQRQANLLMQHFHEENPGAEKWGFRLSLLVSTLTRLQRSQGYLPLRRRLQSGLRQRGH